MSVQLPSADLFSGVSVSSSGTIVLSGEVGTTTNSNAPTCVVATVDPQSLSISSPTTIGCDSAAPLEMVGIVNDYVDQSTNNVNVAIGTVDPSTGRLSEGPVVMTYTDCSDCRPVIAYGTGSLWIYDDDTTGGAEVLQVSEVTGQVLNTVRMPKLSRPLLAADDDGLFVANSFEGGTFAGEAPPSAIYFVSPGATLPEIVIADQSLLACWLTADGYRLWIGMGSEGRGCTQETIWRLNGTDPVYEIPAPDYVPQVVGDEADGLWSVVWSAGSGGGLVSVSPELVRIDPDTGEESIAGTLPAIDAYAYSAGVLPDEAAVADGQLFLLAMPTQGSDGYGTLIRVELPSR